MLLPQSTYCSEGVANFNVMMITMIIIIIIIIMTIVRVEQRPGWKANTFFTSSGSKNICEKTTQNRASDCFLLRVFFRHFFRDFRGHLIQS